MGKIAARGQIGDGPLGSRREDGPGTGWFRIPPPER